MSFSDDDLDAADRRKRPDKPRPKGTLPYLPDDLDDVERLRDWLTLAFRPRGDGRVWAFERAGRRKDDPCSITIRNGRDAQIYRFDRQGELWHSLRTVVIAISDGELQMRHLTASEIEDVWAALCTLGVVVTEYDERDETRKWFEALVEASVPVRGLTLVPDGRHDALMGIRSRGEFRRSDALALLHRGDDGKLRRPVRVVDQQTGDQYVRVGESAAFIRYVLGAEPLPHSTLRSRASEIGVTARHFEDYRPPHPKLALYRLTDELVENGGGVST